MKPVMSVLVFFLCACGSDATVTPEDASQVDVLTEDDAVVATDIGGGASDTFVDDTGPPEEDAGPVADDLDMTADDFDCILSGTKVGSYYIINKLGQLEEAVAVANNPEGGVFPVGTVIQLVPFEAMVKRKAGFSAQTRDWEFFSLETSENGTNIAARGTTTVVNQFGGNCFECHAKSASKWDFICGADHGCDPLGLSPAIIQSVQESDKRCPSTK